ncbi:MAG: hypothetical protein ACE5JQ_09150 [Candidatus Methylomirabilales bacterium]
MRHPAWKVFGLTLFLALLSLRCAPPKRIPSLVKPTQVEVEGAGPLIVTVTGMQKRPLRIREMAPPATGGFLWEYQVKIANPTNTGITLVRLRMTVQNLWGESWPGDQPLNLRMEAGSERQVLLQARLASSNPQIEPGVTGVETLTFLGHRDDGQPISFTVRVPLD